MIPLRDDNPTTSKPVLTMLIIAACVLTYFGIQQPQADQLDFLVEQAAIPCEITRGEPMSNELARDCDGELVATGVSPTEAFFPDKHVYLAMLTSMFLHGSILHLAGNMLFLWIFGNNMEERFGRVGFAAFYVVAGLAATAAHVATQLDSTVPVIGASGAIAGVMGAYLVFYPHARVLTLVPLFFFIQFIYLPAFVVLIGWFLLQFLTNPNAGVAVAAHIGGFVFGAGVGVLTKPLVGPKRPPPDDYGFGYSPYR